MGAPSISVNFIEAASTAIKRGERGVIAMILRGSKAADYTVLSVEDIPTALSAANQLQVKLALLGYQQSAKKIYIHVIAAKTDYADALTYFGKMQWDYLVAPDAATDGAAETIATWIKSQRNDHHHTYKAVLPNTAADCEGIVNVTNGCTYSDGTKLTAEKMCARVAGIICGTPLSMSCTYAPLTEMTDCDRMTETELNAAVDAGKLVFFWDGEKVKICRGVTSFVTTTATKGDSFKKIKLVDAMDMIRDDITMTAQDSYIGKYANNYDNKILLITAINSYFAGLTNEAVLASGSCEIDIDKNVEYYKAHNNRLIIDGEIVSVEDATETQLKQGQTGSYVYLKANVALVDAIEDIVLDIYIG